MKKVLSVLSILMLMLASCQSVKDFSYFQDTKDGDVIGIANAMETGHCVGSPLPLTSLTMEMMQTLHSDGLGQCDHSALAKWYEKVASETIY